MKSESSREPPEYIYVHLTNFLKLEPQRQILGGNRLVGFRMMHDAGVYALTTGTT